ncbi:MAG: hypothetical protein VSS75_016920 [Candidatus Parabeggiatoa sp.]|nr:hypothetical protein [Candidatus Parabeggiatoa sp.]
MRLSPACVSALRIDSPGDVQRFDAQQETHSVSTHSRRRTAVRLYSLIPPLNKLLNA